MALENQNWVEVEHRPEQGKREEEQAPEEGLEKAPSSGQAEAGKEAEKVPRRAHVPRKRR